MEISPNIIAATIAALSALGGSFIGGAMTIWGAKITTDKEFRLKREEVLREAAKERINKLYKPLINYLDPTPPYDDFYLEREFCGRIIDFFEKNELYASSELLGIFWQFRWSFFNSPDEINKSLGLNLYNKAFDEYESLKEILGYGHILKRKSTAKKIFSKISKQSEKIIRNVRHSNFIRKINRRRKKIPNPKMKADD